MPFYHLDIDKFYEDPTPENLLLSLYQPDTLAMLLVREKANTSYLLIAQKQNSHWIPNIHNARLRKKHSACKRQNSLILKTLTLKFSNSNISIFIAISTRKNKFMKICEGISSPQK